MGLFNNSKAPTAIYLIMIITLLIVFFNAVNLVEQNKETIQKNNFQRFEKAVWENQPQNQKTTLQKETPKSSIITGFVVEETSKSNNPKSSIITGFAIEEISTNHLSIKDINFTHPIISYLGYYAIILSLIAGITVITITMIFQRRKNE